MFSLQNDFTVLPVTFEIFNITKTYNGKQIHRHTVNVKIYMWGKFSLIYVNVA